jgi:hypothetical protein
MIKASVNLQDLTRRIYLKAKAEKSWQGLRLEAVEYAMAVRISAAVQRLQGSLANAESRPSTIGPITLEVKQTGERSAGNPHAAFDVAGAGNVARSR